MKKLLTLILLITLVAPVFALSNEADIKEKKSGMYADFFDKNIYDRGIQYFYLSRLYKKLRKIETEALNVNAFDEVPDSSWFTNRNGKRRMSLEEIKNGTLITKGPDKTGKWTIIKGKATGITPGFFIKDSKGDIYILKLDSTDYAEMTSAAEAISSRLFYAIGYNVPQYTVEYFSADMLEIEKGAEFYDSDGYKKELTKDRLKELLKRGYKTKDGLYRVSASKKLDGVPKGPFSLNSRRKDDPEDTIRHKNRREIRCLQVFSSWLNHHDIRKGNTLDVYLEKDGKGYLKHYLIDFGSTLGSYSQRPKWSETGHENILDFKEMGKSFVGLGFYKKPWHKSQKVLYPSIGFFDSESFEPGKWKPELPHYAFDDLSSADGFWAAKIIMSFTDEQVKAVVEEGKISDKEAEKYLIKTIIERRDKIGKYWFNRVTPLDDFIVEDKEQFLKIKFSDLSVKYNFENRDVGSYDYEIADIKGKNILASGNIKLSEGISIDKSILPSDTNQICVFISAKRKGIPKKNIKPVKVSLKYERGDFKIVGVKR